MKRFLTNHNPLYPISAMLVLSGLHTSIMSGITSGEDGLGAGMLAGTLSLYCLLLALAAVFVVKVARIWEDAPSSLVCWRSRLVWPSLTARAAAANPPHLPRDHLFARYQPKL